jgi:hypothetical protein
MALTAPELKKALQQAGFDVYRARGDEVHLAERPRENLILEAGVVVLGGESLGVRLTVRAEKVTFPGETDDALLDRARGAAAAALARGFAEANTTVRSMMDPGDATHVLDTWFEVSLVKRVDTFDALVEEARFALQLEKAASR